MKPSPTTARGLLTILVLSSALAPTAVAQSPPEDFPEVLKSPEDIKKRLDKDKERTRPPIEMSLSQIAPFDVLPYVKANHWSTITLELRANYDNYTGALQTAPVPLIGLPQEIVYRRDARLAKGQRMRLGMQMLLPQVPQPPHAEISVELARPESVRADESWVAPLHRLEPHQMLVVVLTKEANAPYATWNRFRALIPEAADRGDVSAVDKARYYRLVLPLDVEKPPLSPHPLTWSTISHVVWDGLPPDALNPSQQQALLDWLHWGGQLTLVGGPGPTFSILKDSVLGPYLPAESTGEGALLGREDLSPLARAYPPPDAPTQAEIEDVNSPYNIDPHSRHRGYRPPVAVRPPSNRPVFLAALSPKPGASWVALGDSGEALVGVEWRVGRGRVLMLGLNPTDPALAVWPGLDTFVRRVVLRRPEEAAAAPRPQRFRKGQPIPPRADVLAGAELSWVRYLARDAVLPPAETVAADAKAAPPSTPAETIAMPSPDAKPDDDDDKPEAPAPGSVVAAWDDSAALPALCRDHLERASGIRIPGALFVLELVLAYIITLVPLNWLICRYVFRRPEWAWVVVPVLSIGFAVGVERAAAIDTGYNSACDEIDVVESFGGYPRAHVGRFSSLYSTGRTRFEVSFPDEPTALALPLDNGLTLRGESVSTAVWRSYPVAGLEGFLVQPRSLGMVRAEQMLSLDGAISLDSEGEARVVVNRSGIDLRDAVVVDVSGPESRRETYLGSIPSGGTVAVKDNPRDTTVSSAADALRPQRFLRALRESFEDRPENQGEIRLVAWSPAPLEGQKVEPKVDRHRGFTAVVVHLRMGPPPSPDGPLYNAAPRATLEAEPR